MSREGVNRQELLWGAVASMQLLYRGANSPFVRQSYMLSS